MHQVFLYCTWSSSSAVYQVSTSWALLYVVLWVNRFTNTSHFLRHSKVRAVQHPDWDCMTTISWLGVQQPNCWLEGVQLGEWLLRCSNLSWHHSTWLQFVWKHQSPIAVSSAALLLLLAVTLLCHFLGSCWRHCIWQSAVLTVPTPNDWTLGGRAQIQSWL